MDRKDLIISGYRSGSGQELQPGAVAPARSLLLSF
jgi:hypothetical protein